MRYLLILLMSLSLGFSHMSNLKTSFIYIDMTYKVTPKFDFGLSLIDPDSIEKINGVIGQLKLSKASGFVYKVESLKSQILTANHVCQTVSEGGTFLESPTFKGSFSQLLASLNIDPLLFDVFYQIDVSINLKDYWGKSYSDTKIIKQSLKYDLCLLESPNPIGQAVEFAERCLEEKIYNFSASGGFYLEEGIPLRQGFLNRPVGQIKSSDNSLYKDFYQYTMDLTGGASGSAVFNERGQVCGMITLAQDKIGLSYGPTEKQINDFLKSD